MGPMGMELDEKYDSIIQKIIPKRPNYVHFFQVG